MSEYLRAFIGSTELAYSGMQIVESADYVIDRASMSVKGVADVTIGSTVDIRKADGTTSIFSGQIINLKKDTTWEVEVLGNGYELNNLSIQTVWTNEAPEDIIADVVDTYTTGLTYTGTATSGVTITKYIGNGYAIDIIKDMLDLLKWDLTIDTNGNVSAAPKQTVNNGVVFTNGSNVNLANWREDNNNLVNRVRIEGGFESFSLTEEITGTNTVFTLSKKPSGSMRALVSSTEVSPDDYTVDPENKTVTFTSSKTDPTFEYTYSRPVIAEDQNDDSINTYGEIYKRIPAPWLTTSTEARKYAAGIIDTYSTPLVSVTAFRGGLNYDVVLGETVRVVDGVRDYNKLMTVQKIIRSGTGSTTYVLGSETRIFNEWQREVQERIKKIERRFSNQDDIIFSRRLKHNMQIKLTPTVTWKQASPTDTFWLNHTTLGQLRTVVNGHVLNFEADCSANNNYGTWYGTGIDGSQFDNSGYRLACGSFNGSDNYIDTGTTFTSQTAFSYVSFFKTDTKSSTQYIGGVSDVGGDSVRLYLDTNGYANFFFYTDGSALISGSTDLSDNEWHMAVLTWDGTTARAYIDKTEIGTDTDAGDSLTTTNDFYIGCLNNNGSPALYFTGKIDEVMFFDTAISTDTISDIYDNKFYSNHSDYSNLIAWYSMDNPRLGIRLGTKTVIT